VGQQAKLSLFHSLALAAVIAIEINIVVIVHNGGQVAFQECPNYIVLSFL